MITPELAETVLRVLSPGRFFAASGLQLRVEHHSEQSVPWEIFRGHLLDAAHARQRKTFESWNVYFDDDGRSAVPLVSIRWEDSQRAFCVTRNILTYGFEAYEEAPSVIGSRSVEKWTAELVATVETVGRSAKDVEDELADCVFRAVVGTSRLPITSLESPLPGFSLGRLGYFKGLPPAETPWREPVALVRAALELDDRLVQVKAVETSLRASDVAAELADVFAERASREPAPAAWALALFRTLFQHVALSPYTQLVPRLLELLEELAAPKRVGVEAIVDVIGYMLRHLVRHLTAFDLSLFHNFGANYPDALFLDLLLSGYLRLLDANAGLVLAIEGDSDVAARDKRIRRRALRQALLVRKHYEGHRVPDAPTSMGESTRVLPAPLVRVPQEQIVQSSARRRRLFADSPTESLLTGKMARQMFESSLADLDHPTELRELGMAVFLDRPLGIFKQPGEVDRTPLVSYEAFSRRIAIRRVQQMKSTGWIDADHARRIIAPIEQLTPSGMPAAKLQAFERPGVASLADVVKASPDFIVIRSTRRSLDDLLAGYDLAPLVAESREVATFLTTDAAVLLVACVPRDRPLAEATLAGYDRHGRLRIVLGFIGDRGAPRYLERGAVEWPSELQVLELFETTPEDNLLARDLSARRVVLRHM